MTARGGIVHAVHVHADRRERQIRLRAELELGADRGAGGELDRRGPEEPQRPARQPLEQPRRQREALAAQCDHAQRVARAATARMDHEPVLQVLVLGRGAADGAAQLLLRKGDGMKRDHVDSRTVVMAGVQGVAAHTPCQSRSTGVCPFHRRADSRQPRFAPANCHALHVPSRALSLTRGVAAR